MKTLKIDLLTEPSKPPPPDKSCTLTHTIMMLIEFPAVIGE